MEQTMQNIATTLASINAYLAVLTEEVEKKKKKVSKKEENTQRKKNSVYKKKDNGTVELLPEFADGLTKEELSYYKGMAKSYPNICMMKMPLTCAQFNKLATLHGLQTLLMTLQQLNNFSKIWKYNSANETLDNWCKLNNRR